VNRKTICTLVAAFTLSFFAQAHEPGLSTMRLQFKGDQLQVTLIVFPRDLEPIVPLDADSDGQIAAEEITEVLKLLKKITRNLLEISFDSKPVEAAQVKCALDEKENFRFELSFPRPAASQLQIVSKWLEALPPGHRQFVSVQAEDGTVLVEDLLEAGYNSLVVELAPKTTAQKPGSFSQFFLLGIHHIITGYDHLLFLFGLLIVCDGFGSIAKIITCFTLAHSLTLALATFDIVSISSQIIEPAIAASIVYVGVENIFRRSHPKGRWLLTSAFGLVHGFGFASVLREMEIGQSGNVAMPLFSFNVGVEAGQIFIAALVLPVLWYFKRSPNFMTRWVPACSILVGAAGAFWFIQRVWF
jgi:hydrogenase/urease accessory protein HupE